jgi:hypothetical protein
VRLIANRNPQDIAMANNTASPQDSTRPSSSATAGSPEHSKIQGEGDYEAARRYREEVKEYLQRSNVEERARAAAPDSAKQERELALAEEQGKDRSKGDDPVDVGLMYPGRSGEDA